jgi:hypothetical protein
MSMLAACFRAEKEDKRVEESESESETNPEATSEDEATKQETKIELAKKTFLDKLQNIDALFKNNPQLIDATVVPPAVRLAACPSQAVDNALFHLNRKN